MKPLVYLIITLLGVFARFTAAASTAVTDTVTAADAFVRMPAQTLDLLTTSMRLDMVEYSANDSIAEIMNVMEGVSHIVPPVTPDYIQVRVTPVTTLTIRMLQTKKMRIAMSVYTIGDSIQAADSDVRFYDAATMRELPLEKYLKLARIEDFFDFKGVDRHERKRLLDMVPFPTVEYIAGPSGTDLKARLTVGEYLGKETMDKITPCLQRERTYRWTGSRYELIK